MTKSYDDFRVECAKKFTTAEKFRQVKVKLIEARSGFWASTGRRGHTIDACAVTSLMIVALFFCGLYSLGHAVDVIKFYCHDATRAARATKQVRETGGVTDVYDHIFLEEAQQELMIGASPR
jgi:hypothetical protein